MIEIRSIGDVLGTISLTHRFEKDKLIFLNTSDVLEGDILTNAYMPICDLKGQAKKTIENGDILFSEIRPKNKRYAYVSVENVEDYVVSTKLMVLRNKTSDVLTEYIYYFLTYEGTLDYLQMRAENRICSFPQITFDVLKTLSINIPSLSEQQKIVDVISCLNKKIKLNERINTELENLAKTIYDYWFVQFELPDRNGKPYKSSGGEMVYNKECDRAIPAGWEVKKLSEIADITMGQSPDGSSYNENQEGEIFFQGSTDFCWRFPTVRQYTTQPSRMARQGDILLSVRAPVGTLNIADNDCCIGRGLASLRSKSGFNSYLFYVMEDFKKTFDHRNSAGTTFGSINKDDLFTLKLIYPEEKHLRKYDLIVSSYNKIILNNHRQNQQLTQLRDWLLPMLMNGQISIKKK